MDPIIGQTISHYRILSRQGEGRLGVVYKGEDVRFGRKVAFRFLEEAGAAHPDALEQFKRDARAASALDHPHIAVIYDIGEWEGKTFLVRELLEGESLSHRLAERPFSFPEILDLGAQLADALEAAHAAGLFHGNFKPGKIFLTRRGEAKVLDFGLSRLLRESLSTERGASPAAKDSMASYVSPEQVRGEQGDARSDLFSLGAVLYEMAARQPAFGGEDARKCTEAVLYHEPAPPSQLNPEIPPRFDEIVAKALEKDPELRCQTAAELRTDLRRLRRDWEADRVAATRAALVEPSAATATPEQAAATRQALAAERTPVSRRRWMWIAAGLLLAAAAGAVAVRMLRHTERRLPTVFQKLTSRRGWISSARFSADGRIAFFTAAWDGAAPQIYSVRPGLPESRPLQEGESAILSVSSKGELAVLLAVHETEAGRIEGNLAVVPVGGGAPRPVVENSEGADWAPDGSGLAVVRRIRGKDRLEYPSGKVLEETTGWISDPRFSPKGDRIAFLEHPGTGEDGGAVVVVGLKGTRRVLSQGWKSVRGLAWSPKGDEVWFTATRSAARQLYAVSLSGQPRQVGAIAGSVTLGDIAPDGRVLLVRDDEQQGLMAVAAGQTAERDLSWVDRSMVRDLSADGKAVLVEVADAAGGANDSVYIRGTDGSNPVRLGEGNALALSPDGKWVLATETDDARQLVLLPTGGGKPVSLPESVLSHDWAAWLPDGKRFVFLGRQPGHRLQLFVQEASGGPVRAFSPEGVGRFAAISPDGRFVAETGPDGTGHLYPVDGGIVPEIRGLAADDELIGWARYGRVLYVTEGRVPVKVYRLDSGSGVKRLLWQLAPADSAGVTGISGIRVSTDGNLCVYSYRRTLSTLYLAEGLE
jgi:Tol biopolymer transport system component